MRIQINAFGGIMPALDPEKLPDPQAVKAINCKFEEGNLVPMREPRQLATPLPGVLFRTIYRMSWTSETQWIGFSGDVTIVRAPLPLTTGQNFDSDFRLFWAGEGVEFNSASGTVNWPAWSTKAEIVTTPSFFATPSNPRPVGVPAPLAGPTIAVVQPTAPTAGLLGTITALSNQRPVVVSCAQAHGLRSGMTIQLAGIPTGDGNELNNRTYTITVPGGAGGSTFSLEGADGSQWTSAVTFNEPLPTWTRFFTEIESNDRVYVFTYVTPEGFESAPSPVSNMVPVGDGQSVTITTGTPVNVTPTNGPTFNTSNWKKRIYRSVTGETGLFKLVNTENDIPIAQSTYIDTKSDAALGEEVKTEGWTLPPAGLHSLTSHPNGFIAGALNNEAHFSEPFAPYAWPRRYRKVLSNRIVGIGQFGNVLVYATDANPVLAYGSDPQSITFRTLDVVQPCISRRTIATSGEAAFYVSPSGIVMCSDAGAQIVTSGYFNDSQWRALVMQSNGSARPMTAAWLDDSYWLAIDNLRLWRFQFKGQGIINIVEVRGINLIENTMPTGALFADARTNGLFYTNGATRELRQLDPPTGPFFMMMEWQSRTFVMPRETNFSCGQVFQVPFGTGNATVVLGTNGGVDPTLVTNQPVVQRMPGGYMADRYFVNISGQRAVKAVHFATTVSGLRAIAL